MVFITIYVCHQGRELCRLNNLPPSTLSTTPHILHTRPFLILPPSARSKLLVDNSNSTVDIEREIRLVRERAERRLQMLTKEVDWRVAKAYVALADVSDDDADMKWKELILRGDRMAKSGAGNGGNGERDLSTGMTLEARAVERYIDDEEWEERERRDGRTAAIQPFPYFTDGGQDGQRSSWSFWRRKS